MQTGCEAPSFWPWSPASALLLPGGPRCPPARGLLCGPPFCHRAAARSFCAAFSACGPAPSRPPLPLLRALVPLSPLPAAVQPLGGLALPLLCARMSHPAPPGFLPSPQVQPSPFSRPALSPLRAPSRQSLPPPPVSPVSPPARVSRSGQGAGKRLVGKGEGIGGDLSRPRAGGRAYSPSRSLPSPARPSPPPPARRRQAPALVVQKAKQGAALRLPACRRQGFQPVALPFQPGLPLAAPSRMPAAGTGERGAKKKTPFSLWEKEVL